MALESESVDVVAAGEVEQLQGNARGLKIQDDLEHRRLDPTRRTMRTKVLGQAEIEKKGDASSSRLLASTLGLASFFSPKAKGKFSLDRVQEQGLHS